MKKIVFITISALALFTLIIPISLGIVAEGSIVATSRVSRGVAILLSFLQIFEYLVPISFFCIKLFLHKKKQSEENTLKYICLYLFIAILIFVLFVGFGELILENTSNKIGYSGKTVNFIRYNGKIIYFHR